MKWVDFRNAVESFFGEALNDIELLVPAASAVGIVTGNPEAVVAANAAGVIAAATNQAIADHAAAGNTQQSALIAVANIAQAVATSGAIANPTTAAMVSSAASLVAGATVLPQQSV